MINSRRSIFRSYDAGRHITARALRELGFLLPENLPDEAFVPRTAVGLDGEETLADGTATLGLRVLEPFSVDHADDRMLAVA